MIYFIYHDFIYPSIERLKVQTRVIIYIYIYGELKLFSFKKIDYVLDF